MAAVPPPPSARNKVAQYSQEEMELYVDALDGTIQAAVVDGTLIATTFAKKEEIVRAPSVRERQTDPFADGYGM